MPRGDNRPQETRTRADGVTEYLCRGPCGLWKTREEYPANRGRKQHATCKMCRNMYQRRHYRGKGKATRERYMAKIRREDREADELYGRTHRLNERRAVIPQDHIAPEHVRRWLDTIEASFPDDVAPSVLLAQVGKTHVRKIWEIRNTEQIVSMELAERFAQEADAMDELEEILGELGKDGWGPDGARYCKRCGTWWRRHHARGFCRRCYCRVWLAAKEGRPVRTAESWARTHEFCLICQRTKYPHQMHGVCNSCFSLVYNAAKSCGLSVKEFMARELYYALRERKLMWISLNPDGRAKKVTKEKRVYKPRKEKKMDPKLRAVLTPDLRVKLRITNGEVNRLKAMPVNEALGVIRMLEELEDRKTAKKLRAAMKRQAV